MDLRVTVLILMMSRVVRVTDLSYNLRCVNDYVSTVSCTLQSNQSTDLSPKHLTLKESLEDEYIECPLFWKIDHFFCTAIVSGFMDNEVYSICLCFQNKSEPCKQLDDNYKPVDTIKPNPPCCLTWRHNSSLHSFSWKSTYEEYSQNTDLSLELNYELCFYQKEEENGTVHVANAEKSTVTIQNFEAFKPDSEYVAKVRSSPNNKFYRGEWSDWSTEIYWRTPPTVDVEGLPPACLLKSIQLITMETTTRTSYRLDLWSGDRAHKSIPLFNLKKVLIPVCLLIPLFLISCFIPVKKWRRKIFIPTPEPYFHTLYTDYHGDFKSWVVMEKTVELPKTEKTLHIDKMFECEDICRAAPSVTQSSVYANMSEAEGALVTSESTSELDSATASCTSAYLSSKSKGPAEGDSGCWLSSDQSLERGPSWYCNDYCTLSTFQQSSLGTSEPLKCTRLIMGLDETNENDLIC